MLLIIWHSSTGGSAQLAQAALDGAQAQAGDMPVRMLHADDTGPADLLAARGLLFVAPEMLGSLAGPMKTLFDRCYYPVLGRIEGRPYASLICAGSDGQGAERQLDRIVTGWRLRRVVPSCIVHTHAQTPEAILAPKIVPPADRQRAAEVAATWAAGVDSGLW